MDCKKVQDDRNALDEDFYHNYSVEDNLDLRSIQLPHRTHLASGGKVDDRDIYTSFDDSKHRKINYCPAQYPIDSKPVNRNNLPLHCQDNTFSTKVGFDHPVDIPTTGVDAVPTTYKVGQSPPLPPNYKLVFMDDFEGNKLDRSKWHHEVNCWGGGNDEQQCYVDHPDVLSVQDGKLILRAIYVPNGYQLGPNDHCNADPSIVADQACTKRLPVKSARIRTHNPSNRAVGSWKYGRFEMKAKLPHGNYLWPAFWMLPTDYKYGTWAASGEFDIMESRGQKPDEVGHTLHYGSSWPKNVYSNKMYSREGLSNEFNVYGLDWDERAIRFYVNDNYIYQVETARDWTSPSAKDSSPYTAPGQPWDQDFHIILNLAVGGNFFPGGKFDPLTDPKTWGQEFIIDWVRVYQPDKKLYGSQQTNHTAEHSPYQNNQSDVPHSAYTKSTNHSPRKNLY